MAEEVKDTPVEAVEPEKELEPTPEITEEKTIEEVIPKDPAPEKKEPKSDKVGLDKFLEIKKQNKELSRQLTELKERLEGGETPAEISDDIEELAEVYDTDPKFLAKLVKTIESKTEKRMEDKLNAKLAPIEEKERKESIDKIFKEHFEKALEIVPEYKDIVNPEVIKTLSLDPKNANKTFSQIIQETYSSALTGKRTIEKVNTPGGGKEPQDVDITRAQKDPEYFKEVMANPMLKKKYNDGLLNRLSKHL